MAWATFAADGFALTRGEPSFHGSSPSVRRGFRGRCGTALTWAHASRAEELAVSLAAVDDPGEIAPERHTRVSRRPPWVALGDGLAQHAEFRERDGDRGERAAGGRRGRPAERGGQPARERSTRRTASPAAASQPGQSPSRP